ncbi:MAG: leucine-rich repeat domain-containing protein [Bacilli bacterium]|nr:leucine-rich repeat domain-containing protein [Bacilli bacterium]
MNKKTKTLILSIVVTLILLLTFTVTYAAFVYRQTGEDNHQLVLGDIYMHYTETNSGIDIDNMMPININDYTTYKVNPVMATQEVGDNELSSCVATYTGWNYQFDEGSTAETFCRGTGTYDGGYTFQDDLDDGIYNENQIQELVSLNIIVQKLENLEYFEFTISGKNTYKQKDIWYDVVLNHGDVPEGKLEENRINDESLRFALLEVNGENQKNIFYNRSYSSLENKRVHVEIIPKNTTEEINKTYRLYMWIDDSVVIGNMNEDYTMEEWKDVFASIKVNVTGDFNEKELQLEYEHKYNVTDESCFTVETVDYDGDIGVAITDYDRFDRRCGSDVVIPKTINGYEVTTIGLSSFYNYSYEIKLTSVVIPNTVTRIEESAFWGNSITNVTFEENSKLNYIDSEAFDSNQITSIEIPNSVITIKEDAFGDNPLSNVIFEENSKLDYIGDIAFKNYYDLLQEVTIPDSVTYLSCSAFHDSVNVIKKDSLTCTEAGPQ